MPLTREQDNALIIACVAADRCEATTGCPAQLTVAQWALESGWGAHEPGNNCFGIKAYEGCFGTMSVWTKEEVNGQLVAEELKFATFPTLQACFEKHALLLTEAEAYQEVWHQYEVYPSIKNLILGVSPIYATDPQYAVKLLTILEIIENASVRWCHSLRSSRS